MLRNKNVWLLGSVGLIVIAIALVAILDKTSSTTTSQTDVRARAATANTLQFNGTVSSVNAGTGKIIVSDLYLASVSRSGDPTNLGVWTVTAPPNFDVTTISPGANIVIGIDASTFLATSHTLTAITLVPGTK